MKSEYLLARLKAMVNLDLAIAKKDSEYIVYYQEEILYLSFKLEGDKR